jgi:Mg-chelatase subunit ChlD
MRRPLDRKPKQLSGEPALFRAGRGPGGAVIIGAPSRPGRPSGQDGGSPDPGVTDERARLAADRPPGSPRARDAEAYRIAQQIARSLSIRKPARPARVGRRGTGALESLPYLGGSDDVDLDRTIEVLAERPVPDDTDIIVRERTRTRRCVVLAVDVSGSMRGERIRNAAATVGALAAVLRDDSLAVIAFWSDAAVLLSLGARIKPLSLLDDLLQLPARGLTNVAFPLEVARRELAAAPYRDQRVLLLSDALHNAGPDPRTFAAALPRVDVLLDVTGQHDLVLGREIALAGRGRLYPVASHRDVAPALIRAFRT